MQHTIQHLYKTHGDDGLLYAWFLSMHTRVDIILCCQKSENELMLVVNSIYDTLRQLERIANYYDPSSELSQVNQRASTAPVMISQSLYRMISMLLSTQIIIIKIPYTPFIYTPKHRVSSFNKQVLQ